MPLVDDKSDSTAAELRILSTHWPNVDMAALQLTYVATGQEHDVYVSALRDHADDAIKVTRPGGYGIVMLVEPRATKIGWRRGSPRQYLERLARQNQVFSALVCFRLGNFTHK